MLSAQKVLDFSHSLHTGLLRKGLVGPHDSKPISFLCAEDDQVRVTQATLPPQHNFVLFSEGEILPNCLLVNIVESSCFPC